MHPPTLSFPLLSCCDVKSPGPCHSFPNRYVGLVGDQVTHPGVLVKHAEKERNDCLNKDGILVKNSEVKRNGSSQQCKLPAINVLPPLPPVGTTLLSSDKLTKQHMPYKLTGIQYGYSIKGNSHLHARLVCANECEGSGPIGRDVNGLYTEIPIPSRVFFVNEKALVQCIVLNIRTTKNSRGATSVVVTLVTCAPNIRQFSWAGKVFIVNVQTLFERQEVYFLELNKQDFDKHFVPVITTFEAPFHLYNSFHRFVYVNCTFSPVGCALQGM